MTSSISIVSVSPDLPVTTQRPASSVQPARRRHPVERLVAAAIGVHEHGAIGLDDQQPGGERKMGGEPAGVVHAAPGDDEPHEKQL